MVFVIVTLKFAENGIVYCSIWQKRSPVKTWKGVAPLRDVLVLVREERARDVRRVAAPLDVDEEGSVVHRLVLEAVEPGEVDPVRRGYLVHASTVHPRLVRVNDTDLMGMSEWMSAIKYLI